MAPGGGRGRRALPRTRRGGAPLPRGAAVVRLATWLAALGLVAAAGCGTGSDSPGPPAYTAAQVSREFQTAVGRGLERAAGVDPAWEQLGYGLSPSPRLLRRFGVFNVYVVEPGNDDAVSSLLRDKATGAPLVRDGDGVRWERDSQSGTWIAYRRYGENVVLVWFSERRARGTDARWDRLDRILSAL